MYYWGIFNSIYNTKILFDLFSLFLFLLVITTVTNTVRQSDEYNQWKMRYEHYLEEKQEYDAIMADPEAYKDRIVSHM